MKLAFLYGSFSIGSRPLDFDALYSSPRGLTGSEISFVEHALAMSRRGHEVLLVVGQPTAPREFRGVQVRQLDDPKIVEGFDAVLSWNEPNLLREVPAGPLRVVNQQLNDFAYCRPGWEEFVDLLTSPSDHHLAYLRKQAPAVKHWAVLPNGCSFGSYAAGRKVAGRVVWASSADRGLHRLLERWPEIKARAPHASLRCFYNFAPAHFDDFEAPGKDVHPDLLEIAQRKRYIRYAMRRLAGPKWDVEHVGSVSRDRMRAEWEKAEVLAYPCDTIRYTEGFSVTTLEACASGTLPVLSDVDALGSLYGAVAPNVPFVLPEGLSKAAMDGFVEYVVRGLNDEEWREERTARCRALAATYNWDTLAGGLEGMLLEGIARKAGREPRKKSKAARKTEEEATR